MHPWNGILIFEPSLAHIAGGHGLVIASENLPRLFVVFYGEVIPKPSHHDGGINEILFINDPRKIAVSETRKIFPDDPYDVIPVAVGDRAHE